MESKKRTLQTMSPLKIGNVEMQNPLVLAPMALLFHHLNTYIFLS